MQIDFPCRATIVANSVSMVDEPEDEKWKAHVDLASKEDMLAFMMVYNISWVNEYTGGYRARISLRIDGKDVKEQDVIAWLKEQYPPRFVELVIMEKSEDCDLMYADENYDRAHNVFWLILEQNGEPRIKAVDDDGEEVDWIE